MPDSTAVWRELGHSGRLAALYPDGRLDPVRLRDLLTSLDASYPTGIVLSVCVQVATALPLLHDATNDTGRKVYRSALDGETVVALAATDSSAAGSDLMALGTTAELSADRVIVNGGKRWITNASTAQYALVLARHRPQRHFTSFVWVLVPTSAPGVSTSPAATKLFAGSGVGQLDFHNVVLDRDHLVGAPGRGLVTFARNVATERLAGAFWASAICHRVLRDTHRRLRERELWDNQAIRERFARCLVETRRMDALLCTGDTGDLVSTMVLKASAAESLDRVLGECVRLLGAEAFVDDGLAQLHSEAGMFGIAGGATGAMLAGIADHAEDVLGAWS